MTRDEFYNKLLEAQIRGMLLDTYETNNRLTADERSVFFEEIFTRGLFLKNDGTGAKYNNFQEMLTDLKAGKKVINLALPRRRAGYFSFPENHRDLYGEFTANNAEAVDPNALSIRDSFLRTGPQHVMINKVDLAPGEEPAVPGGFFSRMWNRIVKRFTGKSSSRWQEYDRYHEERAMKTVIENKTQEYTETNQAEPGSVRDAFTERVYEVNRAGRVARGEEAPEAPRREREPGLGRGISEEERRALRVEELMRDQNAQEREAFTKKLRQINEWDSDVYNEFLSDNPDRRYKTVDAAYAAALKNYEEKNWNQLTNDARKEIDAKELQLVRQSIADNNKEKNENEVNRIADDAMELFVWKRTDETDALRKAHAYEITKFLKANQGNPEFQAKVDAEAKAMEERCDAIGNVSIYDGYEAFNKYDISIKLALKELNIEGADKYTCLGDQRYAEKKEEIDRHAPPPKPEFNVQLAEEHLNDGTISMEELEKLLEDEDLIRHNLQVVDREKGTYAYPELMPSLDFDLDFDQNGLSGNDKQNKILTLKMMRAQHAAVEEQKKAEQEGKQKEELPFLFKTPDQVKKSIEKALELGFIDQKKFDQAMEKSGNKEPELTLEELAQRQEEEARLEEEHQRKLEEEKAMKILSAKVAARSEFVNDCFGGQKHGKAINEYLELHRMVREHRFDRDPTMRELAEKAEKSLDRALDAKYDLQKYDEAAAIEDVANLIALKEADYDEAFRQNFINNPKTAYNNIVMTVKHNNLQTPLLQEPPMVDSLLLADNPKNYGIDRLYHEAIKYAVEKQQQAAKESVEESLKGYSEAQRKLLQDQWRMAAIMEQINSVKDLPQMTKEEALLKVEAQEAMSKLYNDILVKPQDFGEQVNINDLVDHLASVAMYQSLQNKSYRQAYQTLLGHSKRADISGQLKETLKGKYKELMVNQINVSGIVPKIVADRALLADTVFGDREEFFSYLERYNLGSNYSFANLADSEKERMPRQAKGLKENYDQRKKTLATKDEKTAAKHKYDQDMADLKEETKVMKTVCANLKAGAEISKHRFEAQRNRELGGGMIK